MPPSQPTQCMLCLAKHDLMAVVLNQQMKIYNGKFASIIYRLLKQHLMLYPKDHTEFNWGCYRSAMDFCHVLYPSRPQHDHKSRLKHVNEQSLCNNEYSFTEHGHIKCFDRNKFHNTEQQVMENNKKCTKCMHCYRQCRLRRSRSLECIETKVHTIDFHAPSKKQSP